MEVAKNSSPLYGHETPSKATFPKMKNMASHIHEVHIHVPETLPDGTLGLGHWAGWQCLCKDRTNILPQKGFHTSFLQDGFMMLYFILQSFISEPLVFFGHKQNCFLFFFLYMFMANVWATQSHF